MPRAPAAPPPARAVWLAARRDNHTATSSWSRSLVAAAMQLWHSGEACVALAAFLFR